jgi:glycosyltransferase involved in cell wall biosynthesis
MTQHAENINGAPVPLLSVTVLNYNYGHYLPTCLNSILGQTFKNFELIIINDTSTDNSLEIIQPYLADSRVRLIDHQINKGFVASLIEGSEQSRGKYITVISADDWVVDSQAFEKQVAVMNADPQVAVVFTNYGFYRDEQNFISARNPAPANYIREGLDVFKELVHNRFPQHSGTIIRKTAYDAIGGYDANLHYAVDGHMWLGLCHVGKVAYINDVCHAYRIHGTNMSKKKEVVQHSMQEVLHILDWSFGMLSLQQRRELKWLYDKAVKQTLSEQSIVVLFQENNPKLCWEYFGAAFMLRPIPAVFQKATAGLVIRTILGAQGYQQIEQSWKNVVR